MTRPTRYLLALDQGTSSSRSDRLRSRAAASSPSAQREFRQIFPQPGWVEHDPMRDLGRRSSTRPARGPRARPKPDGAKDIAGDGHHQPARDDRLLWNRATGVPIANAIVWQDRRTAAACEALKRSAASKPMFREQHRPRPRRLLLGHQAGLAARPRRPARAPPPTAASSPSAPSTAWLLWMLTGGADAATTRARAVHATDASNASRTLLFDIHGATPGADDLLAGPRGAALRCCRRCFPSSHAHGTTSAYLLRRADRHRWHRRRPAERALRPGLLRGRPGQEHLRHRLQLHAD